MIVYCFTSLRTSQWCSFQENRFIKPIIIIISPPACQNIADCTALFAPHNRLPLWTISLALDPSDCVLYFKTKMAGNIKRWMDCHTMSVCMDLFFFLRKRFLSASWRASHAPI